MPRRLPLIPFAAGLFLFCWAFLFPAGVSAQQPAMLSPMQIAAFPSLESAIRIKGPLDFCGEFVPLHLPEVRERLEKELLLMLWDRAQVILWLKRTGRYFPHIETVLKGANMPDDLKFIAVIESALKPEAGSNRGACGVWQFISSTGRNYDLVVDSYFDERRNFFFSTRAASQYLRDLHGQFDSWTLACAAYNMGEQGLERQIKKQEVKDYYHLHLPDETERYILRAIAAKLILTDPARYGFDLRPEDYYTPAKFDRIKLKAKFPTPLTIVAKAANTYYKNIRDLNPQLLSDIIPMGQHVIFLPEGAAEDFSDRYQPLMAKYRETLQPDSYVVKRGDSLTIIAHRHNMSLYQLCKLNGLSQKSTIRPGQTLRVSQ
ncbi:MULTISPECIES: lytic transglycosylase domain-containing protein [unclassified Pseudodesulfovibrio]|uniref:lytic transglycosylase domain-containing protein n=1 Tax=unclassified Pseudodesulfovibrio TaxID=2661612 RepID=UPI000FEC1875|nr:MULTISPECIES: lytic transglycosylase domain-containing protein [unclassified Pseudodesulfovibrio]MCJ2165678.1 transglycosylase SLT domain-containing protein [Pseudodesulfovibrio sp. S3-i]RWU02943.1 LysM peptidoglycan-binding domain-containing protein [Pseudodesulfovibrio sp. S3]